ncbi:MAG: hypothetical protein AAFP69_15920 [Planctomycetota bacterium]
MSRIRVKRNVVHSDYLLHYFHCLYTMGLNRPAVKQTTGIQNLDASTYFQNEIPLPSLEKQKTVAAKLDSIREEYNERKAAFLTEIDLMNEFRTALIAEVVTGKLDVRG